MHLHRAHQGGFFLPYVTKPPLPPALPQGEVVPEAGSVPSERSGERLSSSFGDRPRLTLKQAAVLEFVEQFTAAAGWPPTVREVANHFGWASTTAAQDHFRRLRAKGYLAQNDGARSRALVSARSVPERRPTGRLRHFAASGQRFEFVLPYRDVDDVVSFPRKPAQEVNRG